MMKDREDCIDFPAERSESWEMNLMIVSWIYDSLSSNKNSFVYVKAIGADFVLCKSCYKYWAPAILNEWFGFSMAK